MAPPGSQRSEGYRQVIFHDRYCSDGHGANQVVDQAIELGVRNQMSCLLPTQRSTEHSRQADKRLASARQTVRSVIFADQFASHAKHRSLQTEKMSVARLEPIHLAVVLLL